MIERRALVNAGEKQEVELLLARCDLAENVELPVVVPGPGALPEGGIPPLICKEQSGIVGYLALEGWPIPEGTPIVHPENRLRGIGRELAKVATDICRARGLRRWLMVADSVSEGAGVFAERVGARYVNAEYRMALESSLAPSLPAASPTLERAELSGETEEFARTLAIAFDDPLDQVRRWSAEQAGLPNVRLFVAREHGTPVGTARLITVGFEAYITAVGVLPVYRRRGIGRWIVLTAIRMLVDEGWEDIRIEVETTNEAAYRLYRECGFRERRTYRFYELLTGN